MRYAALALFFVLFSTGSFADSAVLRQWLHTNCNGCKEYKSRYSGELLETETLKMDRIEDQLRDPMIKGTPTIRFKVGQEIVEANVIEMNEYSVELSLPRIIISERPLRYGRFTYPSGTKYEPKANVLCGQAFGPGFQAPGFHGSCRFGNQCRVLSITCEGNPEKLLHRLIRKFDGILNGVECN